MTEKEMFQKQPSETCNFIKKENLAQVFSCEFCKVSKNTFCYRTPPACNFVKKETLAQVFSVNFSKFLRTLLVAEHLRWLLLFKKVAAVKIEKFKVLMLNIMTLVKPIQYSSTCSIQLTCDIFFFPWFSVINSP